MEWKRKQERRPGTHKGSSYTSRYPYSFPSFYYILPNKYLAKVLGISKSSASNYKLAAAKAGYITVKHDYTFISDKISLYNEYSKWMNDNDRKKLRCINGNVCLQNPDLIKSDMIIKRNRNLRFKNNRSIKQKAA